MNNLDRQNQEKNKINDIIKNGTLDDLKNNIELLNKIGGPQEFNLTEVKKNANMIQKGIGTFFSFIINILTSYHLNKALNQNIEMNSFALLAAQHGKTEILEFMLNSDLIPEKNRPTNTREIIEHLFVNHHFKTGFEIIEKVPHFVSDQHLARVAESKMPLNEKINYFEKLLDMTNELRDEQSRYILNQAAREDTNFVRVLLEHPRFSTIFNKIEVKEKMFPHFVDNNQLNAMSWSMEQKHSTLYDDNCLAFIWAFNFKKSEVLSFLLNHESMDIKSAAYAISYYQENKHFSPDMYDFINDIFQKKYQKSIQNIYEEQQPKNAFDVPTSNTVLQRVAKQRAQIELQDNNSNSPNMWIITTLKENSMTPMQKIKPQFDILKEFLHDWKKYH